MEHVIIPVALQAIAVIMFMLSRRQEEGSSQRRAFRMGSIIFVVLSLVSFWVSMSAPPT